MATIQALNLNFSRLISSSTSRRKQTIHLSQISYSSKPIKSALQFPDLTRSSSPSTQTLPKSRFVLDEISHLIPTQRLQNDVTHDNVTLSKMYVILEAVSDRIEMHNNIKEQRDNWASLLLNSANMITLSATLAATLAPGQAGPAKLTSIVLFCATTGIMALMSKIQPCQLVEEQRNAVRHFKQLKNRVENQVGSGRVTEGDVVEAAERVLAIDRAYPLPLLGGAMLEKFPEAFEAARWWPEHRRGSRRVIRSEEVEEVMKVVREKDVEDYERLGGKALKVSKALAVAGPALAGMAVAGAALDMPLVAGVCGALASAACSVEHAGQVGMVLEMYRNCAGFFKELEDDVEGDVEGDVEEELIELKVALRLGRSVSELRDLAARSKRGVANEFASKLF